MYACILEVNLGYLFFRSRPSCYERQALSLGPVAGQPAPQGAASFHLPSVTIAGTWHHVQLFVDLTQFLMFSSQALYWLSYLQALNFVIFFLTLKVNPVVFAKYHLIFSRLVMIHYSQPACLLLSTKMDL